MIALNNEIKALENVEITDHYAALLTNWNVNNSGDTIHLGTLGNQIVAQGWFEAINRINQPTTISPIINLLLSE